MDGFIVKRPVANLSFALNYFFHGLDLPGYHLVNITVHGVCGILAFLFFYWTLRLSLPGRCETGRQPLDAGGEAVEKAAFWISGIAAVVWTVHPVQTQSVTYVVQRMTSLSALFYVGSLLSYIRFRTAAAPSSMVLSGAACLVSGIMAMGSKEIAATLPLSILLYEWFFFQDLKRPDPKWSFVFLSGVLFFVLVGLTLLGFDPVRAIADSYARRSFSPYERVLTESRVVVHYVSLLLFPHPSRLTLDHDFPLSTSLLSPPTTLVCVLSIAGCLAWAVANAKRYRMMSFCTIWFFLHLAIESSVIGLEIIFEHRLYLPSMMFALGACYSAWRLGFGRWGRWLRVAAVVSVVFVLSGWTILRNETWRNPIVFWSDAVQKAPGKSRPYTHLGDALLRGGMTEKAIQVYQNALKLDPGCSGTANNLGVALAMTGRYAEAEERFHMALDLNPDYPEARRNLMLALAKKRADGSGTQTQTAIAPFSGTNRVR
jgi:hypothetical protein